MALSELVEFYARTASQALEILGVTLIVIGAAISSAIFARQLLRAFSAEDAYQDFRRRLGRAILLGLEFLVAADIIRTVAVEPTFQSLGVLAVIVLIRTFLSFSLEVEINGRWPWQTEAGQEGNRGRES
jgi:uncharacterized membrane protein